ncbi:MAG: nuclear transport factor 2 family protein [Candidatus Freyarchaeota archaeon]|nr:nuclear transport factor 2 family protein [Candidatus Jordarchaeia archaeon]MBS7268882.1 nuclear transport factor 2 family protein [Candidatus Jordarchaeia archaeon]MBS7279744.1 nuclear transport factor 2 family protein [Candidatus Jordarchaeia archaeon]
MLEDVEEIKKLKAKYCYYVDGYYEDSSCQHLLLREVFAEGCFC